MLLLQSAHSKVFSLYLIIVYQEYLLYRKFHSYPNPVNF